MIHEINGNVLNYWPEYGVLLHQANTQGVSMPGLSQTLARKYPAWWKDYHEYTAMFARHQHELVGSFHSFKVEGNRFICSVFAQIGVSKSSRMTDLDAWKTALKKIDHQTRRVNDANPQTKWTLHMDARTGMQGLAEPRAMYYLVNEVFENSPVDVYMYGN